VLEKFAECVGRGGKARGDSHALGQLRDHLAEAGVFTAHHLDIGHSQVLKRYDQGGRAEACRHGEAPEVKSGLACRGWSAGLDKARPGKDTLTRWQVAGFSSKGSSRVSMEKFG